MIPQIRSILGGTQIAWVYLKIKPDHFFKGALYCKMMQYGIKLSTKHPSETNNNFENSHLKNNHFFDKKNKTFYNIPIKTEIFYNQNKICPKYFANIRSSMVLVQLDRQKKIF